MKYEWNIRNWVRRVIFYVVRNDHWVARLYTWLKPLEELHGSFLSVSAEVDNKLRYNSQQKVLTALLNKLFDSTLKRIRIITDTDEAPAAIIWDEADGEPHSVIYDESEPGQSIILYDEDEIYKSGGFKVLVPTALFASEEAIKGWVDFYKTAGSYYTIQYF